MHILTGIIVPAKDQNNNILSDDEIRWAAEEALTPYEGDVWDWYANISSAGRWSEIYPRNVIRATDTDFFDIVDHLNDAQKNEMEFYTGNDEDGRRLKSISEYISEYKNNCTSSMQSFYLLQFAKLVYGAFTTESHIFDYEYGSSKITEKRISEYKSDKDYYAIVLVDIHY